MSDSDNQDEVKVETGSRCELHILRERYKRDGTQETIVVDSLDRADPFDAEWALVVNQVFTEKNRLDKTILTVNSPHVLKALRDVVKSYPTVASDFSEPFEVQSPFQMLFHSWDALHSYKSTLEDDEALMHLNLLIEFMDAELGIEKKRIDSKIKKGQIDFAQAWTIFRPGELCVRYEEDHKWLLKIEKSAYEENNSIGKWIEVHCTYTDYDGTDVGTAKKVFRITQKGHFAAENPANIKSLPVFPRSFLEEDESFEKQLIERGEHFLAMQGVSTRQYDGMAAWLREPPLNYYHPEMAEFDDIWEPYKETGRIIIDRKTFQEERHMSQAAVAPHDASIDKMLCPPFTIGFSLAKKEWCRFYLPNLTEIKWQKDSFDQLVMKAPHKTLLQALVTNHNFPDNPRDGSQQKGKGLVVLLHGTPGSGKTLTAECAAEVTERALLTSSIAEMNRYNSAWYFEHRLKQVLQYATIWKAVVLLDEADVFLEARKDDAAAAERNALVAVFLRHMEYFSGIVFLTTNRIHAFDQAMKSRIHLALSYRPPELEMRRLIWTQALKAIPKDDLDFDFEAISDLIQEALNGREITNAINTAKTLARFEESALQLKHIQSVLEVRKDFDYTLRHLAALEVLSSSKQQTGLLRRGSLLEGMMEEDD
jgi:hypothetical protein